MNNDEYNNWLAGLSDDQRAALGNRTQNAGAPPAASLLTAPQANVGSGLLANAGAMPAYQSPMSPPPPQSSASPTLGGLLNPDTANAGVSTVPQFNAPAATQNLAAQIHHGFLSNILQNVGGAINNAVSPDLGYPVSDAARHNAQSAAYLALGNSLLNPSLDSRGFKQSTLGSIGSGLEAGRVASQQSIGGAVQAAQYGVGLAQNQRVIQGRARIQQLLTPQPGQTFSKEELISRYTQAQGIASVTGDPASAKDYGSTLGSLLGKFGMDGYTPRAVAPKTITNLTSPGPSTDNPDAPPKGAPATLSIGADGSHSWFSAEPPRQPVGRAGPAPKTPAQQATIQFGVVQKQIGLATSELAAKQRELNSNAVLLNHALAAPIRQQLADITSRRDSLSGVADHLASTVQGTPAAPPHAAPLGVPAHVTAAYAVEGQMYQNAAQSISSNAAFSPAEKSARLVQLRDRYNQRVAKVGTPAQ